jgi:hypothetical protein
MTFSEQVESNGYAIIELGSIIKLLSIFLR